MSLVRTHGASPDVDHSGSSGNVADSKPSKYTAPGGPDAGGAEGLVVATSADGDALGLFVGDALGLFEPGLASGDALGLPE